MNKSNMGQSVCMVGLGYIGLPTAALLAKNGFNVLGVDVNALVVESIGKGEAHIFEPMLDALVMEGVTSGRLRTSLIPDTADIFILAVPTPFKAGHVPDLKYVEAAARSIASSLRPGNLVILESTCPVGTTELVQKWLSDERAILSLKSFIHPDQIYLAHCPERVLPGQILKELVENDRIVGGINSESTQIAIDFYRTFVSGQILSADSRTAELAKLAENTFRDINIAYANELSMVCDKLKIDVWDLIRLANHHPRVNILQPGPGVGGHCIAVDPWFIVDSAPEESRLIRTAREVNLKKTANVIEVVCKEASQLDHPVIACLGLAYKADIDDLRESPAVDIVYELGAANVGKVIAVEPHIDALPQKLLEVDIVLASQEEALAEADIILCLVNHSSFDAISIQSFQGKRVIDTRGQWRING